jgi:hypothetical protein
MKKFYTLLMSALFVGCVTPYQQFASWDGNGYQDTLISPNTYQVSYTSTDGKINKLPQTLTHLP